MSESNNSFENLTHNDLFTLYSKDNKDVKMSLGTFMGGTGFSVWTGAGGRPINLRFQSKSWFSIIALLKKMRSELHAQRQPIMLNKFEQGQDGRWSSKQIGYVAFIIDDNASLFIEVSSDELNGKFLFPVKGDSKVDFSQTNMSERDLLAALFDWMIATFEVERMFAERLSSFKKQFDKQGGGQRKGGGGNWSGGGGQRSGSGGGYNQNNNQQGGGGTFSGGGNQGGGQGGTSGGVNIESDLQL